MAKYNSKYDLLNATDEAIKKFFFDAKFMGIFDYYIPNELKDKFCGKISNITIDGENNDLCPQSLYVPKKYNEYVKEGYCAFSCFVMLPLLRGEKQIYKLQIVRIQNIVVNEVKSFDKTEESYFKRNLRLRNNLFIGLFTENKDGSFTIRDIRRSDFSKLILQNGKDQQPIVYHPKTKNPDDGKYYEFSWVLNGANKDEYQYFFKVDETKPIKEISAFELIKRLKDDIMGYPAGAGQKIVKMLDTLKNQLTASGKEIFIYELLQNANDYPYKANDSTEKVNVEFHITRDSLVFMHSGAVFNERNIAAICSINDKEKTDNKETIGYKGIGFKTVFLDNNYVYLQTGDFSFRFDREESRDIVDTPWQILPIWTSYNDLTPSEKYVFTNADKQFRVKFSLRPTNIETLRGNGQNYVQMFKDVFKNERVILFIPNLSSVKVYYSESSEPDIVCNSDNEHWQVDHFKDKVPPEITQSINADIDKQEDVGALKIPTKYYDFTNTKVSFACEIDGVQLKEVKDTLVYCYLPTKAKWGFKFLMNTDMIPTGPRDDVVTDFENQININAEISEIAGRKFFDWIKRLCGLRKYKLNSIFSLIPVFDTCIKEHEKYKGLIERFKVGFDSRINEDVIIPIAPGKYVKVCDTILDDTGLMSAGIMADTEFIKFTGYTASLPMMILRSDREFISFLRRYLKQLNCEENIWDFDELKEICSNQDFQKWIANQENNNKFLAFLLKKNKLVDFLDEKIFIAEGSGELYCAKELFYDIDLYLEDILPFADKFNYLSLATRAFFNNDISWDEARKDAFAEFNCSKFINDTLLSKENIEATRHKLNNKTTSVHFYNFLATYVGFNNSYLSLPFFDENDNVVSDFKDRFVFLPSTNEHYVCSSQWLDTINISFLSDKYSETTKKYFCSHFGVKTFTDSVIINEIILSDDYVKEIVNAINNDISININFMEYLFTHKDDIQGIEIVNGEEKTINYNRCSNYGLFFVNGNDEQLYLEASDERAFYSIKSDYLEYVWFDNSWIYTLSTQYHTGYFKTKKKEFASFLKKYFGISDMSDGRCKNIAKNHVDEIKVKISSDKKVNLSFWDFLGKFQWSSNNKELELFGSLPVLDVNGKYVSDVASKTNLYYYEKELEDINNSTWIQKDLITILSPSYTLTKNLISLFDLFGFKKYVPQQFAHFFENVIVNQAIPQKVPEEVKATVYNVSLDTEEKCADFHCFMSKKYTLLNDIDKALLKGTPVYVYGKENPRRIEVGYGSYILGEDKFGVIKQCASGLLPEINALDTSFVTDENLTYWTDVQGCVILDEESLCLWIEQNAASIGQTLRDNSYNTVFWTWLFDMGINSQNKIGRLKSLPIIFFTARDTDNNEDNLKVSSLIDTEVYMANSYMGNAQIEDFARKHGKTNFVSSIYIRDTDNNENWRRFFRNLGVKDDVKDVIYSIIMNDLPTIKDKKLPWVLVDQYSKELADPEKWVELAPKLRELQVETTTEGIFVSLANALRITVDDYSKKEPFKMVKLTGEISRDYYQDENVKNLINKIAEEAKTKKIAELQQWFTAKVNQYFTLQDSPPDDGFREIHFSFIKELFGYTEHLERNKIKLYDRDWQLTKSDELYLGSKYDCKCNFEKFGIAKKYVHDEYLQLGKVNDCSRVLRSIGCQDRFKEEDIKYLTDRDFSIYFWCKYVGAKDITILSSVNSWVKDGKFNNVACIPSESGDVKRVCELYSSSLADYMKYIPNYPQKIIDKRMLFTEPLVELCKQCLEHLTIGDIIAFLLNSKPKNRNRTIALQWLLDDTSEDKETWLTTYIAHEKACWLNGQGEPVHLSSLLGIDPNNCNQAYVFKSSPSVIDISYFPQGNELDVCKMFKIPVFSDDDLVPKPVTTIDSGQTLTVSKEIIRRLLLVIAYRYRFDWSDMFNQMKQKMQDVKFMLCESISYGYNDLSIDNEDFYFDPNKKIFYYVDSWQDKKVYESFIGKLCDYLAMDLDYRECKGKLDENFNGKKVANYLNQNCRELYNDEEFISVIKHYWNDIVPLLDIKVVEEPEMDDDEVVEEIKQEKYYEEELNVELQDEQEEVSEEQEEVSEQQEEQSSEDSQTDSIQKNSQSTDSSKTSSPHGTSSTSHSKRPTESTSENNDSQKTAEEQKTATDSKATERKESTENKQSESKKSESKISGSNSSRQRSSSSQRQRTSNYEPKTPTEEEIKRFKYQSSTKSFTTEDMQDNEREALNKILGDGLSPEEIVTENYLAQLRFWNSLKENNMAPSDVTFEDFVRDNKDGDYELTNGKYVHRCSARGGILHISPSIWNMVTDDRCIICVFVGAKVNEFFYIHNKKELLDWIAEDAIVIKLTGSEKVKAVNKLYSEILMDKGTAYTLIRVAYNESYNSLFSDMESNDFNQTNFNDDDYGD